MVGLHTHEASSKLRVRVLLQIQPGSGLDPARQQLACECCCRSSPASQPACQAGTPPGCHNTPPTYPLSSPNNACHLVRQARQATAHLHHQRRLQHKRAQLESLGPTEAAGQAALHPHHRQLAKGGEAAALA